MKDLQDYHRDTTHASKSKLDVLHRSPLEYALRFLYPQLIPAHAKAFRPDENARHFVIGQALDDVVTSNIQLSSKYFRGTSLPRNTTEGKTAHAKALSDNHGKKWLSPDEWEQVQGMAKAIRNSPFHSLIDTTRSQNTITWTDPATGLPCKCRPDWIKSFETPDLRDWLWNEIGIQADEIVFDLKTIEGMLSWPKHVADFRYHVQDALYLDGVNTFFNDGKTRVFAFMVVDVNWPHPVMVRTLPAEAERVGRSEYQQDLQILAACRAIQLPASPTLAQVEQAWPHVAGDWAETIMPSWWMFQNRNK